MSVVCPSLDMPGYALLKIIILANISEYLVRTRYCVNNFYHLLHLILSVICIRSDNFLNFTESKSLRWDSKPRQVDALAWVLKHLLTSCRISVRSAAVLPALPQSIPTHTCSWSHVCLNCSISVQGPKEKAPPVRLLIISFTPFICMELFFDPLKPLENPVL